MYVAMSILTWNVFTISIVSYQTRLCHIGNWELLVVGYAVLWTNHCPNPQMANTLSLVWVPQPNVPPTIQSYSHNSIIMINLFSSFSCPFESKRKHTLSATNQKHFPELPSVVVYKLISHYQLAKTLTSICVVTCINS